MFCDLFISGFIADLVIVDTSGFCPLVVFQGKRGLYQGIFFITCFKFGKKHIFHFPYILRQSETWFWEFCWNFDIHFLATLLWKDPAFLRKPANCTKSINWFYMHVLRFSQICFTLSYFYDQISLIGIF